MFDDRVPWRRHHAPRHGRSTPEEPALHVGVVGAGFAGLTAARELAKAAVRGDASLRVTLIDRHNYHTFQPLLYQVATAALEPQSIGHSIRGITRRTPRIDVRLGTVTDIERDGRRVCFDDGSHLDVDRLVFAVGATTADHGVEGVAEHAFPLKSLPDAMRLRNHVLTCFERVEADPRRAADGTLTFVVAGGGPTGIELAGALAELVDHAVRVDHPHVDAVGARIVLVEMLDDVLTSYSGPSRSYARRALEARGVEVLTGTALAAVHDDRVVFSDGAVLPAATVVWTAGVAASPLAQRLGSRQGKGGRIEVAPDLQVDGLPGVYAIGDVAGARGPDGSQLPQLAPVAIQQGRHVAAQIVRSTQGLPSHPFRYHDRGTMATIGRRDAVAERGRRFRLHGTVAWLAWLLLHLVTLVGFRNRASVLLNWAYSYVTYDRAARLILRQEDAGRDGPPGPGS